MLNALWQFVFPPKPPTDPLTGSSAGFNGVELPPIVFLPQDSPTNQSSPLSDPPPSDVEPDLGSDNKPPGGRKREREEDSGGETEPAPRRLKDVTPALALHRSNRRQAPPHQYLLPLLDVAWHCLTGENTEPRDVWRVHISLVITYLYTLVDTSVVLFQTERRVACNEPIAIGDYGAQPSEAKLILRGVRKLELTFGTRAERGCWNWKYAVMANSKHVAIPISTWSVIASAKVSQLDLNMQASSLAIPTITFRFLSNEGAVLVLPEGATCQNLLPIETFRAHVRKCAPQWYTFARDYLPSTESLFVVTGCDKATSWGIATASTTSGDIRISLKFTVVGVAEGTLAPRYQWRDFGSATVRKSTEHLERRKADSVQGRRLGLDEESTQVSTNSATISHEREKDKLTRQMKILLCDQLNGSVIACAHDSGMGAGDDFIMYELFWS
ncbi:hypothetical protein DFH08DRAFT_1002107 [Mycena albidolilacea]|uniref:Uncharacterized protein n=1 Tax=Mycena albidolilacea TaxID=1033008 RepID=A0AAD7A0Y6_9AGAR|nr:hypothetical protein DFH08DRAFT_1002107 [Mycena albidolilacea]